MRAHFLLIISALVLGVGSANSQSLHFIEHEFDRVVSKCEDEKPIRIHIWNSSQTEQAIQAPDGGQLPLYFVTTNASFKEGYYRVGAKDTIWADVYPKSFVGVDVKVDTIILASEGGFDSVRMSVIRYSDSIGISGLMPEGMVPTNAPTTAFFTLVNLGSHPYAFSNMLLSGLYLDDSTNNDTLYAGESMTIAIHPMNTHTGRYQAVLGVNRCGQEYGRSLIRVYDPRAYFLNDKVIDTLVGCKEVLSGLVITMTIKNDLAEETNIKSVTLSDTTGIRLADSLWKGASIKMGDTLSINLFRDDKAFTSTDIIVETVDGITELGHIQSLYLWTRPRFYIDVDTLRLKWDGSDDSPFDHWQLMADGGYPSTITSLAISDSLHWQVLGAKVGDTLNTRHLVRGETTFKDAKIPGVYPVTLQITTSPCDTVLTRTVIMSVLTSGVAATSKGRPLNVYPSPASDVLHVELSSPAMVRLFDVLGREVMVSKLITAEEEIDVRGLTSGQYILVADYGDKRESRSIAIAR